ncbi:hypothetical protein [Paraburkholderia sp. MM6662-R1]|uniref:hypothetical protein n=1 Tax=Paraburkholderia sp. MM6662-R1 TaxID=2991066 RepID=UPI003D22FECF
MPNYQITLELPSVSDIEHVVNEAVFPLLAQAVRAIAQEAQLNWIEAVKNAKLWSGEKTPYIDSIKVNYLSDFSAEVVSDYKYAYEIENGRAAKDLKAMLNTGTKVRRTLSGKRFLVIPMRHNTPKNSALAPPMPASVYALAKQMKQSSVTGQGTRRSGEVTILSPTTGMSAAPRQTPFLTDLTRRNPYTGKGMNYLVSQSSYKWGGHLTRAMLKDEAPDIRKRYAGMVRMKVSTGGSAYLTFRTMMEGSSGWVVGAKPGLFLAKNVAEHLQPIATQAIEEAMRQEGSTSG